MPPGVCPCLNVVPMLLKKKYHVIDFPTWYTELLALVFRMQVLRLFLEVKLEQNIKIWK